MEKINYVKVDPRSKRTGWIETANIATHYPTLFAIGGAGNFLPAIEQPTLQLFSRLITNLQSHAPLTFMDGATDVGVMKLFNQAIENYSAPHQYLGFAPEQKIHPIDPGKEPKKIGNAHTHIILAKGGNYGDELPAMQQYLNVAKANAPILCILVNGGPLARNEMLAVLDLDIPVVVIKGSEELADEIANSDDAQNNPLIHILNIKENALQSVKQIENIWLQTGG